MQIVYTKLIDLPTKRVISTSRVYRSSEYKNRYDFYLKTCRFHDESIRCGPVLMIPRYLPIKLLKMLTQQFKVKAETLKFTISIFRDYLKQELCAIKTSDNPLFGRFWFKVDSSPCLQGHCFLGEIERDLVRKTAHGTAGSTATPTATMSIRVTVGQGN